MTIEQWKEYRKQSGYTAGEIAELSGIPIDIVKEVIWGSRIPSFELYIAIEDALPSTANMVQEECTTYLQNRKRQYTVEDYYAVPHGIRVELIDGEIYDCASAPDLIHQGILSEVAHTLIKYIHENGGECMTFVAPTDVQLDCDNRTMVQPDIFVVCDRDKLKRKNVFGAPDLVIEILSPSTKYRDMGIKLKKYRKAGVQEYWIIDIEKRAVVVHKFTSDDISSIYGFDSKVPVGIFNDRCEVDFEAIYQRVRFLYE